MLRYIVSLAFAAGVLTGSGSTQTLHTVAQIGQTFVPQHLAIRVGDTVQRVFSGSGIHTVTSDDGPLGGETVFDFPLTPAKPLATFTFDAATVAAHPKPDGIYHYKCVPHAKNGMKGAVTVHTDLPAACPWTDLGFGKAGAQGVPALNVVGCIASDHEVSVQLTNARPNSLAALLVATGAPNPTPYLGGLLAPVPPQAIFVFVIKADGTFGFSTPVPMTAPVGIRLVMQDVIADHTAPLQTALSNAVMSQ